MKRLLIALLVCALSGIAHARLPLGAGTSFKTRVYSGVTLRAATVANGAFLSQVSGSIPFNLYQNRKIMVSDGTNTATGYIKAVGTSEVLGDELITNPGLEGTYSSGLAPNWTRLGNSPVSESATLRPGSAGISAQQVANRTGASGGVLSNSFACVTGQLLKTAEWVKRSAGTGWVVAYLTQRFGSYLKITKNYSATDAYTQSILYGTITADGDYVLELEAQSDAVEGTNAGLIDDASVKRVLTPDSTGCTIASERGGSTQSWTSNGGINPNAASFTVTISE